MLPLPNPAAWALAPLLLPAQSAARSKPKPEQTPRAVEAVPAQAQPAAVEPDAAEPDAIAPACRRLAP